jgi:integrase
MRGVYEHPKHSGVWWICYFENGRRHREKIGRKSTAIDVYRKRKTEIREGRFFPPRRQRAILFNELADDALDYSRQHKRTASFDAWKMPLLRSWFGPLLPSAITPQLIESKLAELADAGRSPATLNRTKALLSLVFSVAMRNGKASVNPARLVRPRRENNSRVRFLLPAEELLLRRAIRKFHPNRIPEFNLALHTGMRLSEQYGLTWPDVDLVNRVLTIPRSKHGEKRHIPINSAAHTALLALAGSPRVCQRGRTWRSWFKDCLACARIQNFRWHDLRHTFASRLVMAGVDLFTVKELLGHKTIASTLRYAHLAPAHASKAVEVLTAIKTATRESAPKGSKGRKSRNSFKSLVPEEGVEPTRY